MLCGAEGVDLGDRAAFVGVVGVVVGVAEGAVAGIAADVAVAALAAAGPPEARRRKVRRQGQMRKLATWVVADMVVDLENTQLTFSTTMCRIKEIESIYLAG